MIPKICFVLCILASIGQIAAGQTSSGNLLTGVVKASPVQHDDGPALLPKPEMIVIRDFSLPVAAVTTDKSVAGQIHRDILLRHGVDEDSSPEALSQRVQAAFAKTLASELQKNAHIPTQKAPTVGTAPSGPYFAIDGEFLAINEGDEAKRILVGFGRGASDIKTHVTISSVAQGHTTKVLEFDLSSQSGKKPGAIASLGVGSLAVGAVAGGVGDRKSTVEADASRMAKLVAKQLETFMANQKWTTSAQ
jgi:hypothetical protein